MDAFKSGLKLTALITVFLLYTVMVFGAGFFGGWYKGVADTLKPMFFEQANATGDVTPPSSPVQFPKDTKEKVGAQ